MSTETRVFLGIGVFVVAMAGLYWFTSYEDAGTTMLVLAAGLSLLTGTYLWRQGRGRGVPPDEAGEGEPEPWFPPSSVWPFGIGVASFFVVNGLIVGSWFLVPGGLLLVATVVGYAVQSRNRS